MSILEKYCIVVRRKEKHIFYQQHKQHMKQHMNTIKEGFLSAYERNHKKIIKKYFGALTDGIMDIIINTTKQNKG